MKKIPIVIIIILFKVGLCAYDWESKDITIIETTTVDEVTSELLKDKDENKFILDYSKPITDSMAEKVISFKDKCYNWKYIVIEKIKFRIVNNTIDIAVFPEKIEYNGTDVLPYLPAGMLFFYTDSIEYNFRITRDNLFIKIKGVYENEEYICKKIVEAIENPHAYIRKRDPEYFLTRLEKLQSEFEQLTIEYNKLRYAVLILHNTGFFGGINPIKSKVIKRVVEIKKKNLKLTKKEIKEKLKKEKIDISDKELFLILSVYFNEFK